MLQNEFDEAKPMRAALYLRMSTNMQNPRSMVQQRETIQSLILSSGRPWIVVGIFEDAGISGRYVRRRPGLQKMLREIRTGAIQIDLILVDTYERFGRAEELAQVRRELYLQYGVVILTADSHFTDPNSVSGKSMAVGDQHRSTEDSRIKSHNVCRGKRDAATQRRWPGGKAPFGFKLERVITPRAGRQVTHGVLVPDPQTEWIIRKLFDLAHKDGLGSTRIARLLNADPEIPTTLKPFHDQTVNAWLKSEIYYGELVFDKHSTGIHDDRRVIRKNKDNKLLRISEFCEGLVSREVWVEVQELRRARSQRAQQARAANKNDGGKQLHAITPGMAIKYILSGLVRCGHCDRAMIASGSAAYITKLCEPRRYVAYICPGYSSGLCPNNRRVPEPWLREQVVNLLRSRLFPLPQSGPQDQV